MASSSRRRMKLGTISNKWSVHYLLFVFLLYPFLFLLCSSRDTITILNPVANGGTLVSTGERFELGFFTTGPSDRSYLGIWYRSDPTTVVWVANRGKPILSHTGGAVLVVENGNLNVLDDSRTSYWSTGLEPSESNNVVAQLLGSGNFVLSKIKEGTILWQSFEHPTDTFVSGMMMAQGSELVSWNGPDDPASGNFTFKNGEEENQFIIRKRSIRYWVSQGSSKFSPSDDSILPAISNMLSNFTIQTNVSIFPTEYYSNKRLVMNSTGEIQYWSWDDQSRWTLVWKEPRDRCSVFNTCGNFGICSLNSEPNCTCLTGFRPVSISNWGAGDFSGGCVAESTSCENYVFLNYTKVRVGKPDSELDAENETVCRNECDCQCRAYSYDAAISSTRRGDPQAESSGMCWIWRDDLSNLQGEYTGGRNLYVRVAMSDKESISRNCEVCGTTIVPYPLSTGPNCGDPMYSSFYCDSSTTQLTFNTSSGTYQVINIDPDAHKFTILSKIRDNCEARSSRGTINQLNQSLLLPFTITSTCNAGSSNVSDALLLKNRGDIEIAWDPPPEPTCTSSIDCKDWPSSSCNATRNGNGNGKGRCLCNTNFKWDPSTLNCTDSTLQGSGNLEPKSNETSRRKKQLILIVVITVIGVSLLSCALIVYIWRRNAKNREDMAIQRAHRFDSERHAKDLIETSEFKEEDRKGIDVPFFEFESILAATDNFSDANKLGQGGYGPVYKGEFPGGQVIAVKRLSSVSGQGLHEFKNEVVLIAKLQHRNLVKLWGYCVKGDEKLLIYEYMPNRSLDAFIFDSELSACLDWEMRFNVILGIARGLLYLHQDSRLRIIHRDMKTSNILLDEEMNPKISDFGLARIVGGNQDRANTNRVVGTYGYMAPEYALDGIFSVKSDVFSFGVVILEIISGKRNTGFYRSQDALSLLGYAWRFWEEDEASKLMDQTLEQSCNRTEFMKCVHVGLLCVQEEPNDRPDIATVITMLGSENVTLPSPTQPAFVARTGQSSSGAASSSTGGTKPETRTQVPELTNSFVDGR